MVLDLGTVISVKDGVVRASGLQSVSSGETVKIGDIYGMALNLEANVVRKFTYYFIKKAISRDKKTLQKVAAKKFITFSGLGQIISNNKECIEYMLGRTPNAFRQSKLAQKIYEDSVLRITKALMPTEQEFAETKWLSKTEISKKFATKYVNALFVKDEKQKIIAPRGELLTGMDIIKTVYPKHSFIKKHVYDELMDSGLTTVNVDMLENKVDLNFFSNVFLFDRVCNSRIAEKFLIDDKTINIEPRFRGHTRQPHSDGGMVYKSGAYHGIDAKLGGIKLDGRSNINYVYLDENTGKFTGICNAPTSYVDYIQYKLTFYKQWVKQTDDSHAKSILKLAIQQISIEKNAPIALLEIIQDVDIRIGELVQQKGVHTLGFYMVPNFLITAKTPIYADDSPRILHKYPNVFDSYSNRGVAFGEILRGDKELTGIIKDVKGSPWEIAYNITQHL